MFIYYFFKAFCYSLPTLLILLLPGTIGGEDPPFYNLEDNWVILHRRTQKLDDSPTSVGQGREEEAAGSDPNLGNKCSGSY